MNPRSYALALIAGVVALVIFHVIRINDGCSLASKSEDHFMAWCANPSIGDFEHGAFYYGLDSELSRSLRTAEVLILGHSLTQFAFSTTVTDSFFSARDTPYFLLGFAREGAEFPKIIAHNYRLTPSALIVDADHFFTLEMSPEAKELIFDRSAWQRYAFKHLVQTVDRLLCQTPGALATTPVCSARKVAIFRSRLNGQWDLSHFCDILKVLTKTPDWDCDRSFEPSSDGVSPADVERASAAGRAFVDKLGVRPDCVILTAVPRPGPFPSYADSLEDLAAGMGAVSVKPRPGPLRVMDTGHLTRESAERWSEAFFREVGSLIERCARPIEATP
jgi:hypothetical protein